MDFRVNLKSCRGPRKFISFKRTVFIMASPPFAVPLRLFLSSIFFFSVESLTVILVIRWLNFNDFTIDF